MIKIAFFDIDGTLLKPGHQEPSENTVLTLKQLKENGILLCMATGRSYTFIPHFPDIAFDVLLTFNGSYVRNSEQVIFRNPLDDRDKYRIIQNLNQMNRPFAISNETMIVAHGIEEDPQWHCVFGKEFTVTADNFDALCDEDIYQIMCLCEEQEYSQILRGTKNAQITAWCDKAADIIPRNSGKGTAVNAVLRHYGFTKEEAIAFGDGKNDIEMLSAAGTGVAMGNAKEETKASAAAVCRSVEEDGVYWYCLEHKLIHCAPTSST